ncbi:MAG: hypothetical protein HFJ80_04595 [Clostridiales bacterium]|nr:hypothetical protein [Clostridiales bacterium]
MGKKKPAVRDLLTAGVVPLTGLEPVRCCQRGIFLPLYVAIAAHARRCGLDFIFTLDSLFLRCAPSSLYTFLKGETPSASLGIVPKGSSTEFDAIHADGFPVRCSNF